MSPDSFFELTARLTQGLRGSEVLFSHLQGETSDFVRLNRSRVRQAGCVERKRLDLHLIDGQRHLVGRCELAGGAPRDLERATDLLRRLRERLPQTPEDPFLAYFRIAETGERRLAGSLPELRQSVADLLIDARGMDLVGICASGAIRDGLASSLGHRLWHQTMSFNLDWSCHLEGNKALKASYSGFEWNRSRLNDRLEGMRRELPILALPTRTIAPGRYRAYLAPAAVAELMDLLSWGCFDIRSHRTAQTPLLRLTTGEQRLHPCVHVGEEHERGLVPCYTPEGFAKPRRVDLVRSGEHAGCLVDARGGKEYGAAVNAGALYPESVGLEAGQLPSSAVLERLGTGLYIGNLWYLNYSDRNDCRITGMTRFGTFWAENGQLKAPVATMRFDDSLYHLLGDRLEGLTKERELIFSSDTYGGRSRVSQLLPGVLVDGLDFVH